MIGRRVLSTTYSRRGSLIVLMILAGAAIFLRSRKSAGPAYSPTDATR